MIIKVGLSCVVAALGIGVLPSGAVYPSSGTFAPGNATVFVFVGFYDPQEDTDLAREDTATIAVVKR